MTLSEDQLNKMQEEAAWLKTIVRKAMDLIEEMNPDFYSEHGYPSAEEFRLAVTLRMMDCHKKIPLDLELLAKVDSGTLMHDVMGIMSHWNPFSDSMQNFFHPRCAVTQ